MLKKILGSVTPAAALAVSLVFAGCFLDEIPSDISLTESLQSIGAPSNVEATPYDGVIAVTWDPAKDAKSYDVYRRTLKDKNGDQPADYSSKYIGSVTPPTSLMLLDIVSFDNQLQHGWKYEYTIVANSGQSTNKDRAAVARAIDDDDVVLNASAKSKSAEAKLPLKKNPDGTLYVDPATGKNVPIPAGSQLTQLEATDISVNGYSGLEYNDQGTILVSWDRTPGYQYELTLSTKGVDGEPTNIVAQPLFEKATLEPLGYYTFPDFRLNLNGSQVYDKIQIRAKFPTDYYLPSQPTPKDVPAVVTLPAYSVDDGFTATVSTSGIGVELTWNVQSGIDNSSYKVFRAETNGYAGTVISSWDEVSLASLSEYYVTTVSAPTSTTLKKRVLDTGVDAGKSYQYYLIITGGNGGKHVAGPKDVTITNYSPSNLAFVASYNAAGVKVSWTVEADVATTNPYELWKAESNGTTTITEWTPVSLTPEAFSYENVPVGSSSTLTKKQQVIDTAVEAGKSYQYKIVVTGKNGGKYVASSSVVSIPLDSRLNGPTTPSSIAYALNLNSSGTVQSLEVSWDAVEGVTYKVYRAQITVKNPILTYDYFGAGYTIANIENYDTLDWDSVITINPINSSGSTTTSNYRRSGSDWEAFFYDPELTARKNYAYKVVPEQDVNRTTVSGAALIRIVDKAPYVTYSDLTLVRDPSDAPSYRAWSNMLTITDGSGYVKDAYVDIYRRRVNESADQFIKINRTLIPGSGSLTYNDDFEFDDPARLDSYVYKAVLVNNSSGTTQYVNKTTDNVTTSGATPAVPNYTGPRVSYPSSGRAITIYATGQNLVRTSTSLIRFRVRRYSDNQTFNLGIEALIGVTPVPFTLPSAIDPTFPILSYSYVYIEYYDDGIWRTVSDGFLFIYP